MDKQRAYEYLDRHHFNYEAFEHHAVYTIEEMDGLDMPHKDKIVKNLFLRDDKKRNYYLVTMPGHKPINLKDLAGRIPSRKLSFANEESLFELLRLEKGHVTPLGVLNNELRNVTVVFDSSMRGQLMGIHPMENTATVFIAFEDVLKLVEEHGNPVVICDI